MRSAIFFGLIIIASAISPEDTDRFLSDNANFLVPLALVMMFFDIMSGFGLTSGE